MVRSYFCTVAATLALVLTTVTSHSWVECTDYRSSDTTTNVLTDEDVAAFNRDNCLGMARNSQVLLDYEFGELDTFNSSTNVTGVCQATYSEPASYDGIPMATYSPGQRVIITFPAKNHVTAECDGELINTSEEELGLYIRRTEIQTTDGASDDDFSVDIEHGNGVHTTGEADMMGFKRCPNFCDNTDQALCYLTFDLEADLAPGRYAFQWNWHRLNDDKLDSYDYTTCWDANVEGDVVDTLGPEPMSDAVAPFTNESEDNEESSESSDDACSRRKK